MTQQSPIRTALAGLIGNVLEWFDFAVYGYFAADIGKQFFPAQDPDAQRLLSFAVLALGFVARPLGSLVLGRVGDRIGRRALLTLSIGLMGGSTLCLGMLPTYAQAGIAAPILLVAMRMIQGFSLGGEFTGSMVYTTELASPLMRGLISSSTAAGTTLGFILGSLAAYLVTRCLGPEAASQWGWRIPFIGSIAFCIVGYFLRNGIVEPEAGEKAKAQHPPVWASLVGDWLPIVRLFGIVAMTNAAYYLTFNFAVDARKSGIDGQDFLLANTFVLFAVLAAKPFGGWLSDRIGRRRLALILTVATMALIYPALALMTTGTPERFAVGQLMMAIPLGMALGMQGAMVVEIFPLRTRVTSMSFGYSITLALAGGTAPLVSTALIRWLDLPMAPAFYVMMFGAIGLAIMWPMAETNATALDE